MENKQPMNKVAFALLTLFLNSIGITCFLQGYTKTGILRIVLGFVTCGIVGVINEIMGIILAIKIFQMSDEEYAAAYGTIDMGIPKMIKA